MTMTSTDWCRRWQSDAADVGVDAFDAGADFRCDADGAVVGRPACHHSDVLMRCGVAVVVVHVGAGAVAAAVAAAAAAVGADGAPLWRQRLSCSPTLTASTKDSTSRQMVAEMVLVAVLLVVVVMMMC